MEQGAASKVKAMEQGAASKGGAMEQGAASKVGAMEQGAASKGGFMEHREAPQVKSSQVKSSQGDAASEAPPVVELLRMLCAHMKWEQLPLFSTLEGEPLRVVAAHTSVHDYFTARACSDASAIRQGSRSIPPPWLWDERWAGVARFGCQMGPSFACSLLQATSAAEHGHLHLSDGRMRGHRPTSVLAVAQLLRAAVHVDLSGNRLHVDEIAVLATALRQSTSITQLLLQANPIGANGGRLIGEAVRENSSLLELTLDFTPREPGGVPLMIRQLKGLSSSIGPLETIDLSARSLGIASIVVIAALIANNKQVRHLSLVGNRLPPAAADAIAPMLRTHPSLTSLDLYGNALGPTGAKAIVHALRDNTRLISLDLTLNDLDEPTQDYVRVNLRHRTREMALSMGEDVSDVPLPLRIRQAPRPTTGPVASWQWRKISHARKVSTPMAPPTASRPIRRPLTARRTIGQVQLAKRQRENASRVEVQHEPRQDR